jgi:hypothetical protein
MATRIVLDIKEFGRHLEELRSKLPEIQSETIHEIGNCAYYWSQVYCPVRSGNLKLRSECDITVPMQATIRYFAPYAPPVEYGSGIYGPAGEPILLLPRNKKALHWTDSEGEHFARYVIQMGQPPRAFLRGGVEVARQQANQIAAAVFDKNLVGVGA